MTGTRQRRASSVTLSAAACALVVLLVRRMGPRTILEQCLALGGVLPAVLALTFLKYPLQAAGWRLALPAERRPPWWPSMRATLAGDALGYLMLAGPVTGEPLRAALLRAYLPVSTGIAVGAVERTLYGMTGALVIACGLTIAASRAGRSDWIAAVVAGIVAVVLAGVVLGRARTHRPSRPNATGWREVLGQLWSDRRPAVAGIALVCLAQHGVLISEAYVMLRALGAEPTVATVLVFEGVTKTVNSVGAIVPGRLGIAEGGSAAMAGALGIGASLGLSLALMRRVRALLWSAVGVALVLPELWRMSRWSSDTTPPTAPTGRHEAVSSRPVPPSGEGARRSSEGDAETTRRGLGQVQV